MSNTATQSVTRSTRAFAESVKAKCKKLLLILIDAAIAAGERMLKRIRHLRWALMYTGHGQDE